MEVKMEVKVEVKRYAQDVSIVNWYRPFLLPLLLPFLLPFLLPLLLPFLLPNYQLSIFNFQLNCDKPPKEKYKKIDKDNEK